MAQKTTKVYYDYDLNCCFAFACDGTRFIFDKEDADLVSSRGWHLSRRGYIAGKDHRRERPLHKLMIPVDSGFDIDHINRDKTDNRRENLRVCRHQKNCFNQKIRSTNTSGFMGASFMKNAGKYECYIHYNGRKYYLGLFDSALDAAYMRDSAAKHFFGDYCNLNFPDREVSICLKN